MSLPLKKRTVHFYELHMQSTTLATVINPSSAKLSELLKACTSLMRKSQLPLTIRKSSQIRTVLSDWNYNQQNNCYELLLSRANAALSDVALRNMNDLSLRKAGKTKVDGIEVSAHILVRPNPDERTAAVLISIGAGISISDIEALFRLMTKAASKNPRCSSLFYFDDPSGAKGQDGVPLQYKVRYRFAGYAHKGQTLAQALQTGEFEGMELIAPEQSQFDTGGNLQITERVLKIKAALPQSVTGAGLRNAIRDFKKSPDADIYDKMRIHYKTQSGTSTSAVLSINDLDAAFTLKEHVEFDVDVDAQDTSLNQTIISGMLPLLRLVS